MPQMKRSTRRTIEVSINFTVGLVMGGILAWMYIKAGRRVTPEIAQLLTLVGVVQLVVLVVDAWRSDELERRRCYVASFVGFMGTGLVTVVAGLLQSMGWPELNWGFVLPLMLVFHTAGGVWFQLRYR